MTLKRPVDISARTSAKPSLPSSAPRKPAAEEEASPRGDAGGKELVGYPVGNLERPEVLALKNGYQNALSHYLAGYL